MEGGMALLPLKNKNSAKEIPKMKKVFKKMLSMVMAMCYI